MVALFSDETEQVNCSECNKTRNKHSAKPCSNEDGRLWRMTIPYGNATVKRLTSPQEYLLQKLEHIQYHSEVE